MEENIFIYRYENIDWAKFDELYEEAKWEICFASSANSKEKVYDSKPENWQSGFFYRFYNRFYRCKK